MPMMMYSSSIARFVKAMVEMSYLWGITSRDNHHGSRLSGKEPNAQVSQKHKDGKIHSTIRSLALRIYADLFAQKIVWTLSMEEDPRDYISRLPDDIIEHIVSLLPYESAVQTSSLSTRWRGLWNQVVLQHGSSEDITTILSRFLVRVDLLDPLRHPWRLRIHYEEGRVLLAYVGAHKKLHLDFSKGNLGRSPREFDLNLNLNKHVRFGSFEFFVKTLHLTSISHIVSDMVSSMISSFHVLEKLQIKDCDGLRHLSVDTQGSNLWELSILNCSQLRSLDIVDFRLRVFRYQGRLPKDSFRWKRTPNYYNFINFAFPSSRMCISYLEEAMLDFRRGPVPSIFQFDMLPTIQDAKYLTLCQWTFEALIRPYRRSEKIELDNLVELWWIARTEERRSINSLLSFLEMCPQLKRLFITVDPEIYDYTSTHVRPHQVLVDSELLCRRRFSYQWNSIFFYQGSLVIKMEGFEKLSNEVFFARKIFDVVDSDVIVICASEETFTTAAVERYWEWPNRPLEENQITPAAVLDETKRSILFVREVGNDKLKFKHPHMLYQMQC